MSSSDFIDIDNEHKTKRKMCRTQLKLHKIFLGNLLLPFFG